jgi:hypothetical protein
LPVRRTVRRRPSPTSLVRPKIGRAGDGGSSRGPYSGFSFGGFSGFAGESACGGVPIGLSLGAACGGVAGLPSDFMGAGLSASGFAAPGCAGPGRPAPGLPASGRPAPGRPSPGRTASGRPAPGLAGLPGLAEPGRVPSGAASVRGCPGRFDSGRFPSVRLRPGPRIVSPSKSTRAARRRGSTFGSGSGPRCLAGGASSLSNRSLGRPLIDEEGSGVRDRVKSPGLRVSGVVASASASTVACSNFCRSSRLRWSAR